MKKRKYVVIVLVLMLVIGFAAVTSTLVINGVLNIGENRDDFKIIFTSAKIDGTKRNDVISSDKTVINYETKTLTTIDEESILDYEVTNTSRNYDAEVDIVCNVVDENDNAIEGNNIYVDMTYEPNKMILLSGETKKGKMTARLIKAVTEPMDINIKCTLTGTAKERDTLGDGYIDPDKTGGTLMSYSSNKAFWQHKANITKVVFENTLTFHETSEELMYDVSEAQDGSVMSYLVPNEEDTTKYTLYINSDGKVLANSSSVSLFDYFPNLQKIEHLEYLDTSNVTDMKDMFNNCSSLTTLDLSSFDTSNVTNMSQMFLGCRNLTTLDLSNFNTSKVINMAHMFSSCSRLTTLDLSDFDTSNVTNMRHMFSYCSSLIALDISSFNTSSVRYMNSIFSNCKNLITLDLSNFNTINVTDMRSMFSYCGNLTSLDIGNFDTSNVTNMSGMFYGCRNLISLDISSFNTINVTRNDNMFALMPNMAIIKVKDKITQDWILALSSNYRPEDWTTENVIIKEA